jgi:hypothetical protein
VHFGHAIAKHGSKTVQKTFFWCKLARFFNQIAKDWIIPYRLRITGLKQTLMLLFLMQKHQLTNPLRDWLAAHPYPTVHTYGSELAGY